MPRLLSPLDRFYSDAEDRLRRCWAQLGVERRGNLRDDMLRVRHVTEQCIAPLVAHGLKDAALSTLWLEPALQGAFQVQRARKVASARRGAMKARREEMLALKRDLPRRREELAFLLGRLEKRGGNVLAVATVLNRARYDIANQALRVVNKRTARPPGRPSHVSPILSDLMRIEGVSRRVAKALLAVVGAR